MKILVTGTAGFIGYHITKKLLEHGHEVVGLDNINGYYDIKLKFERLKQLGISQIDASPYDIITSSHSFGNRLQFIRMDIENREKLPKLFRKEKFDVVCHLAAQAGVRYSIENPEVYVDTNVVGYLNILECCRHYAIKHLVYASSSSIYGLNKKMPFKATDQTDTPVSLYAATKKSNELIAHTYSHLFKIPTTGLRFFTVYGPWGRPDMALFLFTEAILKDKPINVFNHGEMERDFTYIDDIVQGVINILQEKPEVRKNNSEFYKVYNIGNNTPVKLSDFISVLEKKLEKKALRKSMPMQKGDVKKTWAHIDEIIKDYAYSPKTNLSEGISKFVTWYKLYYGIK